MGMLVVLFLIITTIHGTVEGPSARGFSYIEVWYIGMFTPIMIAITEYAVLLAMMKFKVDLHHEITLFGKIKAHLFLGYIDIVFLVFNFVFLTFFSLWYYSTIIVAMD